MDLSGLSVNAGSGSTALLVVLTVVSSPGSQGSSLGSKNSNPVTSLLNPLAGAVTFLLLAGC